MANSIACLNPFLVVGVALAFGSSGCASHHSRVHTPSDQVAYTFIDLGTVARSKDTEAESINNNNEITGYAIVNDGDGYLVPIVYKAGRLVTLAQLDSSATKNLTYKGTGSSLNSHCDITGYVDQVPQDEIFIFDRGKYKILALPAGFKGARGCSINDNSEVTGGLEMPNSGSKAFLYAKGRLVVLPTLAGYPVMWGGVINNHRQIIGSAQNIANTPLPSGQAIITHGFIYSNGVTKDIGCPSGSASCGATSINDSGVVLGWASFADGSLRPFKWSRGTVSYLCPNDRTKRFVALSMNNRGQVVGAMGRNTGSNSFACIFSNGTVLDLNTMVSNNSDYVLVKAVGINDKGCIVALGDRADGNTHSFLLIPINDKPKIRTDHATLP